MLKRKNYIKKKDGIIRINSISDCRLFWSLLYYFGISNFGSDCWFIYIWWKNNNTGRIRQANNQIIKISQNIRKGLRNLKKSKRKEIKDSRHHLLRNNHIINQWTTRKTKLVPPIQLHINQTHQQPQPLNQKVTNNYQQSKQC